MPAELQPVDEQSELPDVTAPPADQVVAEMANQTTVDVARVDSKTVHWLFLIICSIVIGLSFAMVTPDDVTVTIGGSTIPELCSFKRVFAIGCPGCGMTRAFICISSGNWLRAWLLNPASFMMYGLIAFQIPYRIVQLIRMKKGLLPYSDHWAVWYFIALAILLIGQWVVRLIVGMF